MENWKAINGYDGNYEVSDLGRVRSWCKKTPRIRKPRSIEQGYLAIDLYKSGKRKPYLVHRLVAEAFIKNPENKRTVNHRNGIKSDPHVNNLEWSTHSENNIHAYRVLGRKGAWVGKLGKNNPKSKEIIQLALNGSEITRFDSMMDAERAGFDHACISLCCHGKSKTHGRFYWKFA